MLWLYHRLVAESESRLKKLDTNKDELQKFEEELGRFDDWVAEAQEQLREHQSAAGDLSKLDKLKDDHKVGLVLQLDPIIFFSVVRWELGMGLSV